ncbi:unnamed protein product [Ceratitis capitata]|uniref:(Mediterranean fruit fly) hypothetical protein n=1 Tax=Ceratitis capitata TaxID=7213 RepID=A0A811UCJ3_CERCA|nr:unnamed protein product [Ceratitis capitata]
MEKSYVCIYSYAHVLAHISIVRQQPTTLGRTCTSNVNSCWLANRGEHTPTTVHILRGLIQVANWYATTEDKNKNDSCHTDGVLVWLCVVEKMKKKSGDQKMDNRTQIAATQSYIV